MDFDTEIAHPNAIAIAQDMRLIGGESTPIHPRAIGTAQISQLEGAALAFDLCMMPRYPFFLCAKGQQINARLLRYGWVRPPDNNAAFEIKFKLFFANQEDDWFMCQCLPESFLWEIIGFARVNSPGCPPQQTPTSFAEVNPFSIFMPAKSTFHHSNPCSNWHSHCST
jgi:hypothetical protein